MDTILKSLAYLRKQGSVVCAIDGRCGAGKTTLAQALAQQFHANVVHLDDYFLPIAKKQSPSMEPTMPNVDHQRFLKDILLPLSKKEAIHYQKYDCHLDQFLASEEIAYRQMTIIEGSYAMHPFFQAYYDCSIFVDCDATTQQKRIEKRSPALVENFLHQWIPMEETYFHQFSIPKACTWYYDTTCLKSPN